MKTLPTTVAALVLVFFFGATAHADWHKGARITKVWFDGYNQRTVIFVDTPVTNPAGCPDASSYSATVDWDHKGVLSVALAAALTGKEVDIEVHPAICAGNHPWLKSIAIVL